MNLKSFKLLLLGTLFSLLTISAFAGPFEFYGATLPVPSYKSDSGHDFNYVFGKFETYSSYEEPNFQEALALPSPLEDSRYRSYNLIIVINDNEVETNPEEWGHAQTMRIYSRNFENEKGLLYYWGISTGIEDASTNKGFFRPVSFSSRHWSRAYNAPMLWSVFFDGGRALHSSLSTGDLVAMGKRRVSHGCVHVEDHRSEELFHLIGQSGNGTVDLIGRNGNPVKRPNGKIQQVNSYKTLIIIH